MAGGDTSLGGLAGRYALALLELADDKKKLDAVAEDLGDLQEIIAESEDLRRLIRSPLISRAEQAKAGDLTRRFVLVVADNRRLFALPQIIDAYLAELARRRGEVIAEVTSAVELSSSQHRALVDALKASVGAKVQVDLKVDERLIGGLIVKVGSRMIDNSVGSKLRRLQLAMKGVG